MRHIKAKDFLCRVLLVLLFGITFLRANAQSLSPILPQATIDTTFPDTTGYTVTPAATDGTDIGADISTVVQDTAEARGRTPVSALLTANGASSLTVSVGETVTFAWSSTNGVYWTSSYTDNRNGPYSPWIATTASGTYSWTVPSSAVGHTYVGMYTVTNRAGQSATASVTYVVTASGTSMVPALLTANGASSLTVSVGETVTFAWSSTNGVYWTSSYTDNGNGPYSPWIATTASGTYSWTVPSSAVGHTYVGMYTVTNRAGQSATASVTYVAQPTANLSPPSMTFASQALGTTSSAQAVTLTNSGGTTLNFTSIALTGTNASDFAQTNTCGSSLAAGANCTIVVMFTPSVAGTEAASLSIADNASGSPQTVSLSGAGTHDVILSWTASTTAGVVGYDVYRGTTSGGPYPTELNSTPINGTTYTDATVQAGQTYYYVVTAVASNDVTQSADSNEVSATVPSP